MGQRRQNCQIMSTLFACLLALGSVGMLLVAPQWLGTPLLFDVLVIVIPLLILIGIWSTAELLSLDQTS